MNDTKTPGHDGVQLDELIFTLSWEDPALDVEALRVGSNTRIATVASGGCNALTFLLHDPQFVYAFDYKPRGWKFKIKKEVASWPRGDLQVAVEETDRMCYFTMTTGSGDVYAMEIATIMGAQDVVDLFIASLSER